MIYGKGLYLREVVKEDIDRAYENMMVDILPLHRKNI